MSSSIAVIANEQDFSELCQISNGKVFVVFFWAEWHEPSKSGGQMDKVFQTLSQRYPNVVYAKCEAESLPSLSERFEVSVVPTFVAIDTSGGGARMISKIEGASPQELSKEVAKIADLNFLPPAPSRQEASSQSSSSQSDGEIVVRLTKLINTAPGMLFMKGTPEAPRCGFSRKIVELLRTHRIPFASFDILTDEVVRQNLKTFSDWPTYPQFYANGSLVGGLDILTEMAASAPVPVEVDDPSIQQDGLRAQLGLDQASIAKSQLSAPRPIEERLTELINQDVVMLFMKGSPEAPRCGFSKTIVGILQQEQVDFSHFDILNDEEVRQNLKIFSDWPTYPQLYVKGNLVGGLDIIQEMQSAGSLKSQLEL